MGKEWICTPEQEAYLHGEFKGYLKACKDGKVKTWRTRLHEKWEECWPERQALINEWNLANDSLFNPAQMAVLGEALAARKTVMCLYITTVHVFEDLFFLATLQLHSVAH